jgi:hypothetical protein
MFKRLFDLFDFIDLAFLESIQILIAHLSLKVGAWVVSNDLNEPSDIELPKSLGYSDFHLLVPLCHLFGLPVIANVENVETLFKV